MNPRVYNLSIILTLVSMESSHLVIFSTSGKFITKFNVLRCISLRSRLRIEVRPTENDLTQLYKNGDISVVITCS